MRDCHDIQPNWFLKGQLVHQNSRLVLLHDVWPHVVIRVWAARPQPSFWLGGHLGRCFTGLWIRLRWSSLEGLAFGRICWLAARQRLWFGLRFCGFWDLLTPFTWVRHSLFSLVLSRLWLRWRLFWFGLWFWGLRGPLRGRLLWHLRGRLLWHLWCHSYDLWQSWIHFYLFALGRTPLLSGSLLPWLSRHGVESTCCSSESP